MNNQPRRSIDWRPHIVTGVVAWVLGVSTVWGVLRLPGYMKMPSVWSEMLTIESEGSSAKIVATTKPDGVARIWMDDPDGKTVLSAEAGRGSPQIALKQADGAALVRIEILPSGKPRIRLVDPSTGKPAWTVTVDDSGKPKLE